MLLALYFFLLPCRQQAFQEAPPQPILSFSVNDNQAKACHAHWMGFVSGRQLAVRYMIPGSEDATLALIETDKTKTISSVAIPDGGGAGAGTPACSLSPKGDWISYVEGSNVKFMAIPPHQTRLPHKGEIEVREQDRTRWADIWINEKADFAYMARKLDDGIALYKWNIASNTSVRFRGIDAPVSPDCVVLDPTSSRFAVSYRKVGNKPKIDCWTLGVTPTKTSIDVAVPASSLAVSPDGRLLVAGLGNGNLAWYATGTGKVIHQDRALGPLSIGSLAFHHTGKYLACGTFDRNGQANLFLLDVTTGDLIAKIPADPNGINAVCFSPNGDKLAAFGTTGTVTIWDATKLLKLERD